MKKAIRIKKIWEVVSIIGFMFFSGFIAVTVIIVMVGEVKKRGFKPDSFGVLMLLIFGIGWLYQIFQYHIRDEELNNLKEELIDVKRKNKDR